MLKLLDDLVGSVLQISLGVAVLTLESVQLLLLVAESSFFDLFCPFQSAKFDVGAENGGTAGSTCTLSTGVAACAIHAA